MRRHTDLPERRQVLLDASAFRVNTLGADALLQLGRVVDTLATRQHLLPTNEEIKGICHTNAIPDRSARVIELGIEWSCRLGEFVNHVKVGVVLGTDDLAKRLLLRSAHILIVTYVCKLGGTFFSQQLLRLGKRQADFLAWLGEKEGFRVVNGSDRLNFVSESLCN